LVYFLCFGAGLRVPWAACSFDSCTFFALFYNLCTSCIEVSWIKFCHLKKNCSVYDFFLFNSFYVSVINILSCVFFIFIIDENSLFCCFKKKTICERSCPLIFFLYLRLILIYYTKISNLFRIKIFRNMLENIFFKKILTEKYFLNISYVIVFFLVKFI
jgi:hypothetical protein